ncbi:MAG: diaminopimelate decarboxylase [Methanomassiliicoccales archaeon]|jgi:diaminopimelate decarboxylase
MVIGGIPATKIADRFGTPVYVTDELALRENFRRINKAFSCHMPTHIHYACKANTNIAILRILKQEGSYIDAVSIGEVETCLRAGFPPERIMFTGVCVSTKELEAVASKGVLINIDSFSEMKRLAALKSRIPISIRVNPDVGAGHHDHVVTGSRKSKFGIPLTSIMEAYSQALDLGLIPVGLHAHIGAGVQEIDPFVKVTDVLVSIAKELEEKLKIELEFIDIGGGIGIPYRPDEKSMDVDLLAREVTSRIKAGCSVRTVAIEPGRYIVADTTVLLTRVVDIKETPEKNFACVDAGFNILIRPSFYGSYHHIAVANKFEAPGEVVYDIVGPICESGDFLARDRLLPKLDEGDLLAVYDAGAYGFSMSSQYNSRPRCRELLIYNGTVNIIREMETIDDILRHQKVPSRLMV